MKKPFERIRLTLDGHSLEVVLGLFEHSVRFDGQPVPAQEGADSVSKTFEVVVERPGGAGVTYRVGLRFPAFGPNELAVGRDGQLVLEMS